MPIMCDDHLALVLQILDEYATGLEVRAFGSRVGGGAGPFSDLDLALVGDTALDWRALTRLRRAFQESRLPFRVDVLDWATIPEHFRKNIENRYEVIRKRTREGEAHAKDL